MTEVSLEVDERNMLSVDIFYTQQGQVEGVKDNSNNTKTVSGTMLKQVN